MFKRQKQFLAEPNFLKITLAHNFSVPERKTEQNGNEDAGKCRV
jgi:hypothetical protein